jgi:alanyl-tRNA synthetase
MVKKRTVIHDRKSKKVTERKHDGFVNLFGGETIESLKAQRDKLIKQLENEKKKKESNDKKQKLENETKKSKEIDKLLEDEQKQKIKDEINNLKKKIKDINYPEKQEIIAKPVVIDSEDFPNKTDRSSLPLQVASPIYPNIKNTSVENIIENNNDPNIQNIPVPNIIRNNNDIKSKSSNKVDRRSESTSFIEMTTSFVLVGGFLTGVVMLLNKD